MVANLIVRFSLALAQPPQRSRRPRSLDPLPRYLSPVEALQLANGDDVLVFTPLDLLLAHAEDDLDVARVALVRVDATVCAVCAAAGFL